MANACHLGQLTYTLTLISKHLTLHYIRQPVLKRKLSSISLTDTFSSLKHILTHIYNRNDFIPRDSAAINGLMRITYAVHMHT